MFYYKKMLNMLQMLQFRVKNNTRKHQAAELNILVLRFMKPNTLRAILMKIILMCKCFYSLTVFILN